MKKFSLQDLKNLQNMTFEEKLSLTKDRIIDWYTRWDGKVYVSISGKDSTVLLDIVRKIYPEVPAVYVDTGLEFPEVRELALSHENVIVLHPKEPMHQILKKYGYQILSKEISECIDNARKHLRGGGYTTHWNKLQGLNEFASKSKKDIGHINKKGFP